MALPIERSPIRRTLTWIRRALFCCGALMLGYTGFVMLDSWVLQKRESADFDRLLSEQRSTQSEHAPAAASGPTTDASPAPLEGLVGRIEIPRLKLSAVVLEGSGSVTLRHAVGHITGTALPGQRGNVGVAGHRDTFFRGLKDLQMHDEVNFSTLRGTFRYEVDSLKIVDPSNVEVLAASAGNVLTIVTCYPFTYLGAAPRRFIATARQVSPTSNVD